jgi:hypothetical protein
MVVHQAVGVQLPVEPIDDRGKDSQKALPVLVIEVDCLPAITRGGHMIQGAVEFDAKGSSHVPRLTRGM